MGHKTNVPSFLVNAGDSISVRESSRTGVYFKDRSQILQSSRVPSWLSLSLSSLSGTMVNLPAREDVSGVDLNEQLIVEFYSR